MTVLFNTGVTDLDNALGGVEKGKHIKYVAPTKTFKTVVSLFLAHRAIVSGINTGLIYVENNCTGVYESLLAKHFAWYHREKDPKLLKLVTTDTLRRKQVPSELKDMLKEAQNDLSSNPTYGKLVVYNKDFETKSIASELEKITSDNNLQFIVFDSPDYMVNNDTKKELEPKYDVQRKVDAVLNNLIKKEEVTILTTHQIPEKSNSYKHKEDRDTILLYGKRLGGYNLNLTVVKIGKEATKLTLDINSLQR